MTAPDPTILAAAIKCAEEDLQTFRGIDDPEIKKLQPVTGKRQPTACNPRRSSS